MGSQINKILSIREHPDGIVFKIRVQPRSSRNAVSGLHADSLKIKVTAPPVNGAANKMCIKFLAKCLSTPPASLEILGGHNGRTKTILLKSDQPSPSTAQYTRLKQKVLRLAL